MEQHLEVSRVVLSFQDLLRVRYRPGSNPQKGREINWHSLSDYLAGKVKVDEYVTHTRTFAEINGGFHDMHVSCCFAVQHRYNKTLLFVFVQAGDCIRCVVDMSEL